MADMAPPYIYHAINGWNTRSSSNLIENGRPEDFYRSQNVLDDQVKTAWCAGNAKNPGGIGEWIEVDLYTATDGIALIPGFGASQYHYRANNRIKDYELVVTHANGRLEKIRGTFPIKTFAVLLTVKTFPDVRKRQRMSVAVLKVMALLLVSEFH